MTTLVFLALPAAGQKFDIDTNTPEGQLLEKIGTEEDLTKKAALLDQFAQQHPKHEATGWVYSQLATAYAKLNQPAKALEAGEKMLEAQPTNVEGAHAMLKIAEEQKNPDWIKKWAVLTHGAAKKAVEAPAPKFEDSDQEQEWKQHIDFAKQVGTYAEYSVHAAALQTTDAAKKIELAEALKQMNPQSQYLPAVIPQVFLAYRQLGNMDKAVATAEEFLAKDPSNEDMLLVTADYYMNTKKDPQKTIDYSTKLVQLMSSKPAPQGVAPADWEKKKKSMLGIGNWMIGVTYATQGKLPDAAKTLRQTIPLVEDNPQLLAPALFHLGVANFKLGEKSKNDQMVLEAFNLFKRCATIQGPFQGPAQTNISAIQRQYHIK
jgi:tetratricopeptide (TPR) repeat protein